MVKVVAATVVAAPLPSLAREQNIFAAQRSAIVQQDYDLQHLQMVGYMSYHGINYAFLKTPLATLKVKVGDMLQSARVIKITTSTTELINKQITQDAGYLEYPLYLELAHPQNLVKQP